MNENNDTTQTTPIWKARWFCIVLRIISVLFLILILILAIMPIIISSNIKSWLLKHRADDASIVKTDCWLYLVKVTFNNCTIKISSAKLTTELFLDDVRLRSRSPCVSE